MATAQGLQRPHNSLYNSTGPEKAIQHTSLPARRQKVLLLCEWSQWFTGFLLGLDSTSCCPYLRAGQPQLFQIHSGLDSPSYSHSYSNSLAYLRTGQSQWLEFTGLIAGLDSPRYSNSLASLRIGTQVLLQFLPLHRVFVFQGWTAPGCFSPIVCRILKTSKNSHEHP